MGMQEVRLKIGRKTMQPIYDFVDKSKETTQLFLSGTHLSRPIPHPPDRFYLQYKSVAPDESTRGIGNIAWLDETRGHLVDYLRGGNPREHAVCICRRQWLASRPE